MGQFIIICVYTIFVGFFILYISAVIERTLLVWVRRGEVIAFSRPGSRRIARIFDKPGWYWYIRRGGAREELRLRVDEPVIIRSEAIEIRVLEATSAVLTVRLTTDVTSPARYISAVVEKQLEEWIEAELPSLIAPVVSSYTFTQIVNDRGQVAQSIAGAVAASFSDTSIPNFGLAFRNAAIAEVTSPPIPKVK